MAIKIAQWIGKVCVSACVHVWACVVYQQLCPAIQHSFSQYSLPACIKILLSSHRSSQLRSQTGRLRAPVGKVCCLCAHKHCHFVKLPSSSKSYRVIRYTGEINSSAPEKSCTHLPHLPVHITRSLPLWWGIMQACLTPIVCECSWRWEWQRIVSDNKVSSIIFVPCRFTWS